MQWQQAGEEVLPFAERSHQLEQNFAEILRLLRILRDQAQAIIDNPPGVSCNFGDPVVDFVHPSDAVPTGATVLEAVSALTGQVAGNHVSQNRGDWEIVRYRVTGDTPIAATPALQPWRVMTSMDDTITGNEFHRHAQGLGSPLASNPVQHIGNVNSIVGVFPGAVDANGNQHWYVDVRLDYQADGGTLEDYPHPSRVQLVLVPV